MEATMQSLPVRIEFVETREKVQELLPTLYGMVVDGMIDVQDTRMMRIFLGEAHKWHGEPLDDAIVKKLRMEDMAGATVYRGILGFGAKRHTHEGQSFGHLAHDCPVMISITDSAAKIAEAVEIVEGMLQDGLIVISDVEMIRLAHTSPTTEVKDARTAAR